MLLPLITLLSAVITVLFYVFNAVSQLYWLPVVFAASFTALFLCFLIFLFICTRFINTKQKCVKHSPFYRACADVVMDFTAKCLRIKLHVSGMELLPSEKFLLVGNHRGAMDPLLTMNLLRSYNMGFVAKKIVFKIPIISRLMHKCFCLSLDRESSRKDLKTITEAIRLIKSQTASIGIYPEGTRNPTDELLPFMHGAFKIAKKAECPIVVAAVYNTETVMKNAPVHKTDVHLDFIGVLDKDFVNENSTLQISEKVRDMINEKLIQRRNNSV